eukprot:m.172874 g.172874  ORF g.172874 m.172874 type:complete len:134 (+) comp39087_c0_seq13:29-430(+)
MTSEFEEGGYDAEFVEPLDKDLECPVCMSALKEPVLTSCGHNFCCICAEKLTKYGKFQCPLDNQECQERDVFRDRKVERKVLSLLVYCSRKDQGCSWKGELRDIELLWPSKVEFGATPLPGFYDVIGGSGLLL